MLHEQSHDKVTGLLNWPGGGTVDIAGLNPVVRNGRASSTLAPATIMV